MSSEMRSIVLETPLQVNTKQEESAEYVERQLEWNEDGLHLGRNERDTQSHEGVQGTPATHSRNTSLLETPTSTQSTSLSIRKKLSPLQMQLFLCNPEKFEHMIHDDLPQNSPNSVKTAPGRTRALWTPRQGLEMSEVSNITFRSTQNNRSLSTSDGGVEIIEIEDSSDDEVQIIHPISVGDDELAVEAKNIPKSPIFHQIASAIDINQDMETCTQEELDAHCQHLVQLLAASPPPKTDPSSIVRTPPPSLPPLASPSSPPSTPSGIWFSSHELHFKDFFLRFFVHQEDHMEIVLRDSFYFLKHHQHPEQILGDLSVPSYKKNHSYFLNLNHPIIHPHDFLRLFRKLNQLFQQHDDVLSTDPTEHESSDSTPSSALLHYFHLFQPQSSIIFQSPIQIKNFIKNIGEIIPALKETSASHVLENFTLYDTDENYEDDELVHLLHACVRNLFEHTVQMEENVVYHGELFEDENSSATGDESQSSTVPMDLDDNCTPHGFGRRVKYASNSSPEEVYIGYWKHGMRHGEGHLTMGDGSSEYHGDFCDGNYDGVGTWKNQIDNDKHYLYIGDFKQGKRHGYGVMKLIITTRVQKEELKPSLFRDMSQSMRSDDDEPSPPRVTIVECCKEWYRGEWTDDYIHGFGEMRSVSSWKMGTWMRSKFIDGCGMALNQETEFFERIVQGGIGHDVLVKPLVPKGYFESLLKPQITSNTKQAQRVLYKGYCFRSRLETRWALFFEFLGIDYLYECKKFSLPDGRIYTPDFYLPKMFVWIEIKPLYPTEEEREKAQTLSRVLSTMSNQPWRVLLIYGDCEPPFIKKHHPGAMAIEFFSDKLPEEPCIWVQCSECHRMDVIRRGHHVNCSCPSKNQQDPIRPALQLKMAFEHAKKFDFEGYNQHLQNYYENMDLDKILLGDEDDA